MGAFQWGRKILPTSTRMLYGIVRNRLDGPHRNRLRHVTVKRVDGMGPP